MVELDNSRHVSTNTYEVCADGISPEKENLRELPFGESDFWYATLCENKFFMIDDVSVLDGEQTALRDMLLAQNIHAIMLAPLWHNGKLVGFLGADNPGQGMEQIGRLTAIADYISLLLSRRDMARRIAQREEEYRLATEHSGRTICRYCIADMTLTVAEDTAKRLALPPVITDVPYGRVKLRAVSPDTTDAYLAFYEAVRRGEKESTAVFRKHLITGWRWLSAHATTTFNADGQAVSAIISFADVTEQQEKEAIYRKWKQNLADRKTETYTLYQTNLNKSGAVDTKEGTLLDYFPIRDYEKSLIDRARDFAGQYVCDEDRKAYLAFMNADPMLASYYRGKRTAFIDFRVKQPLQSLRRLRLTVELVEYPHSTDVQAFLLFENIGENKQ